MKLTCNPLGLKSLQLVLRWIVSQSVAQMMGRGSWYLSLPPVLAYVRSTTTYQKESGIHNIRGNNYAWLLSIVSEHNQVVRASYSDFSA